MLWDPASPSESPLFILVRWLSFSGTLLTMGALLFSRIQRPAASVEDPATTERINRALGRLLIAAAWVTALAAVLRAVMQRWSLNTAFAPEVVPWGDIVWRGGTFALGFWLQLVGAACALASARLSGKARSAAAGVALGSLAVAPGLSGHAAAGSPLALSLGADALHMLAAGAWMGGLAVILLVAIPVWRVRASDDSGPAVRRVIAAFTPWALGSFAVLGATGVYAGWRLVGSVEGLFGTRYGAALLVKLGLIGVTAVFGFLNWRRYGPATPSASGMAAFRRVATAELGVAVLILLVTAALVGRPSPME